jgi:methionine aminopeptidase
MGVKRKLTITVDEAMFRAHKLDGKNISGYINSLLVKEYMNQQRDSMVKQVADSLLGNEPFMHELSERLKTRSAPQDYQTTRPTMKEAEVYLSGGAPSQQPTITVTTSQGRPCCSSPKPCRHWHWDGAEQAHINELTGARREVL